MNKKYGILVLAIFMSVTLIGSLFAQEEAELIDESPSIEEFAEEPAELETVEEKPARVDPLRQQDVVYESRAGAKTYFDGYNTYVNSQVRFELRTSDNIYKDLIFYSINDGEEIEYSEPFTIQEEGKARITYYSVDKVGNKENRDHFVVYVDNTPPDVQVTLSGPFVRIDDRIYVSETFVYTYIIDATDNLSGVANIQYSIDGEKFQEFIKPVDISSPEGPAELRVLAIDQVGNATSSYVSKMIDDDGNVVDIGDDIEFFIDNEGPEVAITADRDFIMKNGKKIASRDYLYTVEAYDNESGVSKVYYRINAKGDFIPYTGEIELKQNGKYIIEAIAKDKVGNTSKTAKLEVYVDTIAPKTEIELLTGE